MAHAYTYQAVLASSEKINWRVEDLIGGDKKLDFSKPFMPESLARVTGLDTLTASEKLVMNQIRGFEYLCLFGVVEEFILPFLLDHMKPRPDQDDYERRAILCFADEEAKHIHLFKRFRQEFEAGFRAPACVIGPPEAIAREVLSHQPLAVATAILQIEWMTQRHYIDSVQDDTGIDPLFKSLLKHHWMEEAQHAKIDTLVVEALAESCTREQVARALDEYLEIGMFLDGGLAQQVALNLATFETATGRTLGEAERAAITRAQHQAMRWTYLGSGITHENFLTTMERVLPGARAKLEKIAPDFS